MAVGGRAFGAGFAENSKSAGAAPMAANRAVIDAAYVCEKDGEICLKHCLDQLAKDNTLAECARSVQDMLVACHAISSLAIQKSSRLKEMATVCAKICRDCEAACQKHASHHEECRRCGESCKTCAAECDKVA